MKRELIYPIILAGGRWWPAGFTANQARAAREACVRAAMANCQQAKGALAEPVVVLGWRAAELQRRLRGEARLVVNRRWRAGQLASLRAGMRRVPQNGALLVYPADLVFVTPKILARLARAFERRRKGRAIVMPRCCGRAGHPVIFSAAVRKELRRARTAREAVYRDAKRLAYAAVRTTAIWRELKSPRELERALRGANARTKRRAGKR
jgi:CTP:molybdopterin cytidylyltransferase MocA